MSRRFPIAAMTAALLAVAAAVSAQEPAGPPPSSLATGRETSRYHELLPDIGRIGAQAVMYVSATSGPYGTSGGIGAGGYLDLPLFRAPAGKVSWEILIDLAYSRSDPRPAVVSRALTAETRLRLLRVSPVGFKYTVKRFDAVRLRPFVHAGLDILVALTRLETETRQPILIVAGIPAGGAEMELGGHFGAGLEVRLGRGLSLDLDCRFGLVGENETVQAGTAGLGFHW